MSAWYFLVPWLVFSGLTLIVGAIFFLWGLRSGQFTRQDRARYLALWADVPEEENKE